MAWSVAWGLALPLLELTQSVVVYTPHGAHANIDTLLYFGDFATRTSVQPLPAIIYRSLP